MSLLILSASVWASASTPIDLWHTDFKNGKLSSDVTVAALSEAKPQESRYKNGYTENGWAVYGVGGSYCAVSPTATGVDIPSDNVFYLPAITIPSDAEGVVLRWSARSILPGLPEDYEISVRLKGEEGWTRIYGIEGENDFFTTRVVSLDAYAGQEIELRFSCVSANRYMLAISDIYVGVPAVPLLCGEAATPRFAENMSPREAVFSVLGDYVNCGAMIPAGASVEVRAENVPVAAWSLPEACLTGAPLKFEIPFEAPDDTTTPYQVVLVMPDSSETVLMKSDVTRSGFARKLFVDEATGIWCNNCPKGVLDLASMEREYPGQVIPVCTHINDILANADYFSKLEFYAVPYFMLNRDRATVGSGITKFASAINAPTYASIRVLDVRELEPDDISVRIEMMFSKDIDDTSRYGYGYVLTSPFHCDVMDARWMQTNNLNRSTYEQYYFLPSLIPSELCFYNHVSIGAEHAFDPITPEWPVTELLIPAYTPGYSEISLGKLFNREVSEDEDPAAAVPEDISLVVYVIDKEDGKVLNAETYPLQQEYDRFVGAPAPTIGGNKSLVIVGREARFNLPDDAVEYNISVADITGRVVFRYTGVGSGATACLLPAGEGVRIVTLVTPEGSKSVKYIY